MQNKSEGVFMQPLDIRESLRIFMEQCLKEYARGASMPHLEQAMDEDAVFVGVDGRGLSCPCGQKAGASKDLGAVASLSLCSMREVAPALYMAFGCASLEDGRAIRVSALCRRKEGVWRLEHCHVSLAAC